jgi:hypothetical protein
MDKGFHASLTVEALPADYTTWKVNLVRNRLYYSYVAQSVAWVGLSYIVWGWMVGAVQRWLLLRPNPFLVFLIAYSMVWLEIVKLLFYL